MDADKISGMFLEESTALAITRSDAEWLARELYGITASASELPGEYDCNFHLRASDGREFVLKCMHPARKNSFIDMQCAALAHLARHAGHLRLPRIERTAQGDAYTVWNDAAEQGRLVWKTQIRILRNSSGLWEDFSAKWIPHSIALNIRRHAAN